MSDAIERLLRRKEEIESVVLGDVNHMNLIELEAMVLHHAQQIKDIAAHLLELKRLVTPMMMFNPQMPTKLVGPNLVEVLNAAGFYQKKEWVGLTDDELLDAYGWRALVENNRLWGDSDPMLEKARQDVLVGLRKTEAKLKEKNGG